MLPLRLSHLIAAAIMIACTNDDQPVAVALVVAPPTATLVADGAQQFTASVTWSDGASHPATFEYHATGGTITEAGWYVAGPVPGRYAVATQCSCGLTDTVEVQVVAKPEPPVAALNVEIAGLPIGVAARVAMSSPHGFARALTASASVDSLLPGAYVIEADSVSTANGDYGPKPVSQLFVLNAGQRSTARIVYAFASVDAPTGLPPHPRVWMTPQRVEFLRKQAAGNTIRWQRVKAYADAQLQTGARASIAALPALCAAYLATGASGYAERAGVILDANTDSAMHVTMQRDNAYYYKLYLPSIIKGLDWCYHGLTMAQRQRTATWLMDAADWVWPETNPDRRGKWAVTDVGNNYYWGFMLTGPAALAAAGDDTGSGAVSGRDRASFHQHLALSKWQDAVVPWFASPTGGAGGAWPEGTGYETSGSVALFAFGFATSGIALQTDWLQDALRWHIHYTEPGGAFFVPFGDQARVSNGPMFRYNRLSAEMVREAAGGDATLLAEVQRWLDWIGQVPSDPSDGSGLTTELLSYDPDAPTVPSLAAMPTWFFAPAAGFFVDRQNWTDSTATAWAFQAGPYTSHNVGAANSLRIWKGSFWVSADANIYSHTGINHSSAVFNTLTLGDEGQRGYGVNDAVISSTAVSDTLVSVTGHAANTYGYPDGHKPARIVQRFSRTVQYRPLRDQFTVIDSITADDTLPRTIRWHSRLAPTISGSTFELLNPNGDAGCSGTVSATRPVTLGLETFTLQSNTPLAVSSNAVTITLPPGRATDVMVTVLNCSVR